MEIKPIAEMPEIANNLLKRLKDKRITLDEYLTECAYWYMEVSFDKIKFKPYPYKPTEVIEYENMNPYKKEHLSDSYFNERWQIGKYYEEEYKTKWVNVKNLRQMEEVYEYIPSGDTVNRGKLREKIRDFRLKMEIK